MAHYILNPRPDTYADVVPAGTLGAVEMNDTEFSAWLSTQPPVAEPLPVIVVSRRQIRLALNQLGLRAAVEAAVAAAGQSAQDEWLFSDEMRSDWPLVAQLKPVLNKTDAEVRAIFELAATF